MSKQESESLNVRQSLRAAVNANENARQPILGSVSSLTSKLFSELCLQLFRPSAAQSMCKYYGHVVDEKKWKRGLPNCRDCGIQINSRDELRGSIVKGNATRN